MTFVNILLLLIFGALLIIVAVPVFILRLIRGNMQNRSGFRRDRREGEVSVSGKDANAGDKIIGDNVGEYVEYEEVDDNEKQ